MCYFAGGGGSDFLLRRPSPAQCNWAPARGFDGSAARRLQSSSGWAVEIQPALQREIRPPPLLKGVRCGLDPTRSLAKLPGKQCGPNPTPSHSTAPGLTPPPLKGVQCGLDPTRSRAKLPGKQCGPIPNLSQGPFPLIGVYAGGPSD